MRAPSHRGSPYTASPCRAGHRPRRRARAPFDDQIDLAAILDRTHTKELCHIDDADAAQLHIVPQHLRRRADQLVRRDHLDLDRVVRDQAVTALDKLDGRLTLADAAVAHDQNALAVNLDKDAVARHTRRKIAFEVGNEA